MNPIQTTEILKNLTKEILQSDSSNSRAEFIVNNVRLVPTKLPHVTSLYALDEDDSERYKTNHDTIIEFNDLLRATAEVNKPFDPDMEPIRIEDAHWLRFADKYIERHPLGPDHTHSRSVRDKYTNAKRACRELLMKHYESWQTEQPQLHASLYAQQLKNAEADPKVVAFRAKQARKAERAAKNGAKIENATSAKEKRARTSDDGAALDSEAEHTPAAVEKVPAKKRRTGAITKAAAGEKETGSAIHQLATENLGSTIAKPGPAKVSAVVKPGPAKVSAIAKPGVAVANPGPAKVSAEMIGSTVAKARLAKAGTEKSATEQTGFTIAVRGPVKHTSGTNESTPAAMKVTPAQEKPTHAVQKSAADKRRASKKSATETTSTKE